MKSVDSFLKVGEYFRDKKEFDTSIKVYSAGLEIKPDNETALVNRAYLYCKLGRYSRAFSDLNKVLEINPNDELALIMRGETYKKFKKYSKALTDFNRALEVNPNNIYIYGYRASLYKLMDKKDLALEDLKKALSLLPRRGRGFASTHKERAETIKRRFEELGVNIKDYM